MGMLACLWARRRLGAHLDGALGARAARATAAHLEGCPRCRADLAELERLHTTLSSVLASRVPVEWSGFWEGIAQGIEQEQGRDPLPASAWAFPRSRLARHSRLALGGALAAAALAGLVLWQARRLPPDTGRSVVVSAAHTERPAATVMVYSPPEHDLAVVWVFDPE